MTKAKEPRFLRVEARLLPWQGQAGGASPMAPWRGPDGAAKLRDLVPVEGNRGERRWCEHASTGPPRTRAGDSRTLCGQWCWPKVVRRTDRRWPPSSVVVVGGGRDGSSKQQQSVSSRTGSHLPDEFCCTSSTSGAASVCQPELQHIPGFYGIVSCSLSAARPHVAHEEAAR